VTGNGEREPLGITFTCKGLKIYWIGQSAAKRLREEMKVQRLVEVISC